MMKLGIANYYSVLKKNIAEESALTEEVFWNMVWKDSSWHGAPGG